MEVQLQYVVLSYVVLTSGSTKVRKYEPEIIIRSTKVQLFYFRGKLLLYFVRKQNTFEKVRVRVQLHVYGSKYLLRTKVLKVLPKYHTKVSKKVRVVVQYTYTYVYIIACFVRKKVFSYESTSGNTSGSTKVQLCTEVMIMIHVQYAIAQYLF